MFVREHTPRNARVPTLEASNQVQIDDLVQRNRALEQANKNLEGQLYSEQRRNKEVLAEIQEQLHRERQESREGCDVLISCHRLVNLRTLSDLETVKTKFLQEQEVTRQEKEQRLQRDTQILNFQIREGDLEDTIARLKNETGDILARCGAVIVSLRRKLSTESKTRLAQILALEKEKDEIQDKLSQLLQDHATLQTSAKSSMLNLERVTLQLEGARTKNTELERSIDEVKRNNAELQRQLEKWQTLDAKGNGELEAIRKQKMELEVKLSSLQDRSQRQAAEKEKELERMTKRDEKMKDLVQQWQREAEEEKSAKEKMEKTLAEARTRIKQLEMESRTTSGRGNSDEGYVDSTKSGSKSSRSPTQSKKAASSDVTDADLPRPSRKAARKPKSKLSPVTEVVMDEVGDAPILPAAPGRSSKERNSKKALKNDKGKAKVLSIESETEDDADQRNAPKGKRRRKISSDSDEVEVEVELHPTKMARERARGDAADVKVKGRRGARQKDASDVESEAEQAPMKKKRKINIFSKPAEPTFAFMGNDIAGIGLDIPTILSPVKETTGVPNRSTSASVMNRVVSKTFSKR